jgi:hypothetical protein
VGAVLLVAASSDKRSSSGYTPPYSPPPPIEDPTPQRPVQRDDPTPSPRRPPPSLDEPSPLPAFDPPRARDVPRVQEPAFEPPPSSPPRSAPGGVSARVVPVQGHKAPVRDAPGFGSNIVQFLPTATSVTLGRRVVTQGKNTPDVWYQVTLDGAASPSGWMHEDVLMQK